MAADLGLVRRQRNAVIVHSLWVRKFRFFHGEKSLYDGHFQAIQRGSILIFFRISRTTHDSHMKLLSGRMISFENYGNFHNSA